MGRTSTAVALLTLLAGFGAVVKFLLFPSERAVEPTHGSKRMAFWGLTSTEEHSTPWWDFQRMSPSADQSFWMFIGALCCSLVTIAVWLVRRRYRQDGHNEGRREQKPTETRVLLEMSVRITRKLKHLLEGEREEGIRCHAHFVKRMDSLRKLIEEEEERRTDHKALLESVKLLTDAWSGQHGEFDDAMNAAKNMIIMEKKLSAKYWEEMDSMKETLASSIA
jgi:hypothetical protein